MTFLTTESTDTTDTTEAAQAEARQALACLDLTSLNEHDSAADIVALCRRAVGSDPDREMAAQGPLRGNGSDGPLRGHSSDGPLRGHSSDGPLRGHSSDGPLRGHSSNGPLRGPVAAVCVWPRRAALARRLLPPHIAVAAVANFPDGSADVQRALRDTRQIVGAGAQEVDVVFPYRDFAAAPALLQAVRKACSGLRLKVILETGEMQSPAHISRACHIALQAGADFLKTSSGKTPRSASPEAAVLLLQAIAEFEQQHKNTAVGFKPAGGIRTMADAALYMRLTAQHLGAAAVSPARFRIGASSLLDNIEALLAGVQPGPAGATY